jgi:hypothetical protein
MKTNYNALHYLDTEDIYGNDKRSGGQNNGRETADGPAGGSG